MPVATSVALVGGGLALAGAATSTVAGLSAASAQKKAGQAQLAAAEAGVGVARDVIERQLAERRRLEELAAPSQAELDNIATILSTTEQGLQRSLQLLDQEAKILDETDPVIKESAKNLTALLKGEQAKILAPLREQRKRNKADLEQKLAGQLGPGFRTSAAGIQALNQFDQQSDEILTNAQFQATNQVAGVLQGTAQIRRGFADQASTIFSRAAQSQAAALAGQQNIAQRRIQAASIQPVDFGSLLTAQQGVIGSAQAPFAGDITRAQTFGQLGKSFGEIGGTMLGAGLGGGAGASFLGKPELKVPQGSALDVMRRQGGRNQ